LVLGVAAAGIAGKWLLSISLGGAIAVFLYSLRLKRTAFWGNFTVSLLCGLVFVYGGVCVGKPKATLIPAFLVVCVGIIPVICYVIWSIWRDNSSRNLGRLSSILKLDMLVGLLAILLGSKF
ncbi:MAG: hypothetical protein B1H40_03350, partial [Candidatus Latescibacteria bacterium 4484_181]